MTPRAISVWLFTLSTLATWGCSTATGTSERSVSSPTAVSQPDVTRCVPTPPTDELPKGYVEIPGMALGLMPPAGTRLLDISPTFASAYRTQTVSLIARPQTSKSEVIEQAYPVLENGSAGHLCATLRSRTRQAHGGGHDSYLLQATAGEELNIITSYIGQPDSSVMDQMLESMLSARRTQRSLDPQLAFGLAVDETPNLAFPENQPIGALTLKQRNGCEKDECAGLLFMMGPPLPSSPSRTDCLSLIAHMTERSELTSEPQVLETQDEKLIGCWTKWSHPTDGTPSLLALFATDSGDSAMATSRAPDLDLWLDRFLRVLLSVRRTR